MDLAALKEEFPALGRLLPDGRTLHYLDSAASSLRPRAVAQRVFDYYAFNGANVHRGSYYLSERATEEFEACRELVKKFLKADDSYEIVFTSGTTDSLNLLAASLGHSFLRPGDVVVLTEMEHHANIVPWQMLAKERGLTLKYVPVNPDGELALDVMESLTDDKIRLIAITQASNTLGTINPLGKIGDLARSRGWILAVDGAQGAAHGLADLEQYPCDFYAFSGHKVFGPSGVGVLCARKTLLKKMPPYRGGGGMIQSVTLEGTSFAEPPARFEAGTPNVAGVLGLGEAMRFALALDWQVVRRHEKQLMQKALLQLGTIEGLKILGHPAERTPILSMVLAGVHPHDLASVLDRKGVAVRSGQHCTEPLMRAMGQTATTRASFHLYNTEADIEALYNGLKEAVELFR
jgi:cysteine desulfurase/selenocysteine lyase